MSYNLNSLNGVIYEIIQGTFLGVLRGYSRGSIIGVI